MSSWLNVDALWRVLVFGLIVGAGLPALFAVGIRVGAGDDDAAAAPANRIVAGACFGVVAVAVVLGVTFVARDFIGFHTGVYLLGAHPK